MWQKVNAEAPFLHPLSGLGGHFESLLYDDS
jgi:hypothetical protein